MPVSGTVTITGSSADFVVNASGSGFGIFSSYSAYASEHLALTSSGFTGVGSASYSLDTSFGNLIFSGTDTISTFSGSVAEAGSEQLSFVVGSDTLSFGALTSFDVSSATSTQLASDAAAFFSSVLTVNNIVPNADSVAAATGSLVALIMGSSVTVGGATTANYVLGESNGSITITKLS